MGIEKNALIEADDSGWTKPEGYVCPECVEDEYLKDIIIYYACDRECNYCGKRTRNHSAAPVIELMEPISTAILTWFSNPEKAGELWDSEDNGYYSGNETFDTSEVMESLSLECHHQLFTDISEAFVNEEWVETAYGHWLGSHPHELMEYAWEQFTDIVKHESRYFFQQTPSNLNQEDEYEFACQENYNPAKFLPTLGELVKKLRLIDTLSSGEVLFRARPKEEGKLFDLNAKELGAPPPKKAKSGRMNPAGISYMYLAYDQETALKEALQLNHPQQTAIGQFITQRELQILNLTNLPQKPSIFDSQNYEKLVGLLFFDKFVSTITKPVSKDGSEHIDYVPSQVISEYFAAIFNLENDKQLDGIKFPSAICPNSYNIVLFPSKRGANPEFNQIKFQSGYWEYSSCNQS